MCDVWCAGRRVAHVFLVKAIHDRALMISREERRGGGCRLEGGSDRSEVRFPSYFQKNNNSQSVLKPIPALAQLAQTLSSS